LKKSKYAVETTNLSISWGAINVLDQLNFELNEGEKLAIVGPSGSGKSTILKILAGLILPTKGELRIFGEKQTYLRLDQNNPPDVRLVFQNPALLGSLTIEENVGFLLKRNKNLSKKLIHEIVLECLAEVGLFNVENKLPNELSGGMQKRVSFARALLLNTKIFILDEATSYIDSYTERQIQNALDRVLENRTGIIIAHRLSTIKNADKIIVLNKGEIVEIGSHEKLLSNKNLYWKLWSNNESSFDDLS